MVSNSRSPGGEEMLLGCSLLDFLRPGLVLKGSDVLSGYVCRYCGKRNVFQEDFEYVSYKEGMRIVSEITKIVPVSFVEREEVLNEATRIVRITLEDMERILIRDMRARLSQDLGVKEDMANDILLEVLVELGKMVFLERDKKGLWLRRSL